MIFAETALREVRRRLAALDDEEVFPLAYMGRGHPEVMETYRRREHFERYARRLEEGGVSDRPPRTMPSAEAIAEHHGIPRDRCWRCWCRLRVGERAHLICRALDGLDAVQNLAILCHSCHRRMPEHSSGMEPQAIDYAFRAASSLGYALPTCEYGSPA